MNEIWVFDEGYVLLSIQYEKTFEECILFQQFLAFQPICSWFGVPIVTLVLCLFRMHVQ